MSVCQHILDRWSNFAKFSVRVPLVLLCRPDSVLSVRYAMYFRFYGWRHDACI